LSLLRVNQIQDASGGNNISVPGVSKAWVNFNGTGTVAIRASLNVSSITDNGVGNYTVNFASALPDANFCTQVTGQPNTANTDLRAVAALSFTAATTGGVSVVCGFTHTSGNLDQSVVNVTVFD
jgi:hypothetical protein